MALSAFHGSFLSIGARLPVFIPHEILHRYLSNHGNVLRSRESLAESRYHGEDREDGENGENGENGDVVAAL